MRKILIMVICVVMTVSSSVIASAASLSKVSVKNNDPDSKPITYTYESDQVKSSSASIKTLMTKLDGLQKQDSIVQTLTITSENADSSPVSLTLRLALPNIESDVKPEPANQYSDKDYLSINYYNIRITDSQGNVVYSYEDEPSEKESGMEYKDIPLGEMNQESMFESKIFNITISVNKSLKDDSVAESAKKLDWIIMSETVDNADEMNQSEIAASENADNKSSFSKEKNGDIILPEGEYLCGKDIEPGRYTMTGSGKVHVYAEDGALKSTVALKNNNDDEAKGVSEYIINLNEGERVETDSEIKFSPYSTAKVTSKPKRTDTPKTTSSASKSETNKKSNPKTGDVVSIGVISVIALAALSVFAVIEIKKRRKN